MWADKDTTKVEKGSAVMEAMGRAILTFSKSLALASILLIPAAIGIPLLYLATILVVPLFLLLGMADKQITKGARALDKIGDGLKSFAIGLAFFALVTFFILMQPVIILGMVITLVLISGVVALIGMFSKQIRKGSVALAFMGLGLGIFGLGYALFAITVMSTAPTLEAVAIQAGILIGLGVVTAILGSLMSLIVQGAVSFAAMGLGLLIFGLGYIPFAYATEDVTWEGIAMQAALLTGLGVVFALAGVGILFILAGAAAFGAIGLALLVLAPGLSAIQKVNFTEEDAKKLTTTLAGVKSAFMGTDGKESGGFFASLKGALVGAVDSVKMLAAAAGFSAAGISLILLSKGLSAFSKLGWTDSQTMELTTMLSGITVAFAQAGGEPANPGGLFGAVFGNAFSPNATERGIDSVMGAGKALTKIAVGLKAFQALIDQGVDWDVLGDAIAKTVGFIQRAFSAVAEEGNVEAGGFFNTLFGIKKNKVKEGIDSVTGAGKALTGIAEGLMAFQELVDSKVDFDAVGIAITKSVGFVQEAFSAVADQGNVPAGGFWGSLFGIKKNKVQEGIQSVQGAGKALTGIAEGLMGFQKLIESDVDFDQIGVAISKSIGFVQEAFSAVADQGTVKAGGFWGSLFNIKKNKVQEGIKSVSGAGDELSKIAKALSTFAGIEDPEATAEKIKVTLGLVGGAFAQIGGMETTDDGWFGISWDENLVEKGIDAVDGAGEALTDIAKGLEAFSKNTDPVAVAKSIGLLLTSIGTTFSDLYTTNPFISMQLDDFATFIVTIGDVAEKGQLEKAADGISKIADAVNKIEIDKAVAFGDLFKSSAALSSDRSAYRALAKAVGEIRDMMAAPAESEEGGDDRNVFEKVKDKVMGKSKSSGPSPVDRKLLGALGRLNTTMGSLPGMIASIDFDNDND
jgi:hypothetical protein